MSVYRFVYFHIVRAFAATITTPAHNIFCVNTFLEMIG